MSLEPRLVGMKRSGLLGQSLTRRKALCLGGVALARPWRAAAATPVPDGLSGKVIWPHDPGYDAARQDFNARFSRFPAAIVMCEHAADVQTAVRWARQYGVIPRARSGGHSYEAYSVLDDGLVIDVSGLNTITVDASRETAVIGAGVRMLDLYRGLADHGVTVPGGTCPHVGIAGLALGGGIGFLSRQHGLTCDHILAVDLVDANGDLLRVTKDQHPDLFWALQGGGGGNFGIAAAFTFRVRPIQDVALFTVTWPSGDAAEVIDAWQRWAPAADNRLAAGMGVSHPAQSTISSTGLFIGPQDELRDRIAPLLRVGSPQAPNLRTVSYLEAAQQFAGSGAAHSIFKNASAFVSEPLSQEGIATLLAQMAAAPPVTTVVGIFALGGAVAAVDPEATAFAHRRALLDLQYQAYWEHAADEQASVAWVGAIRDAMAPYTSGAYVNYIDAGQPDWAQAYYGANLARLARVKVRYDPDNLFSAPQAIPAGRSATPVT